MDALLVPQTVSSTNSRKRARSVESQVSRAPHPESEEEEEDPEEEEYQEEDEPPRKRRKTPVFLFPPLLYIVLLNFILG